MYEQPSRSRSSSNPFRPPYRREMQISNPVNPFNPFLSSEEQLGLSSPDSIIDSPPPFPVPRTVTDTSSPFGDTSTTDTKTISTHTTTASKIFHIYHTAPTFNHYNIQDSQKRHVYHVHTSYFTPGKPDLTIHAGPSDRSPTIAVAHFTTFSSSFKVGLGDPAADPRGTVWEDLTQISWHQRHYKFETEIPGAGTGTGADLDVGEQAEAERHGFMWKRTQSVGVEKARPSRLSSASYKLVDQTTGEIVAVFTETVKAVMKKGKLEIRRDYGPGFETMVIATGMAVLENQARE